MNDLTIGWLPERSKSVFQVLGISGSGRKSSYNSALLKAGKELLPDGSDTLETYGISRFPLFNEDLEANVPAVVIEFKKKIRGADAIRFATPEYNYTISAVLKNAQEWGNRPEGDNSWDGKPAAIISASAGPRGGARAQLHLRQIIVDLNIHPINTPQLLVARAQEKFDRDLRQTDEHSRKLLRTVLAALLRWARRLEGEFITLPMNVWEAVS